MGVRLALLPSIKQFLYDYRELCPQSTVFSELHYLEEHIVKFVSKWKVGPSWPGGRAWRRKHLPLVRSAAEPLQQHPGSSILILPHARRASSDRLSFSSLASQKNAKKGLKEASLELMILHGMTVFYFSSKKKKWWWPWAENLVADSFLCMHLKRPYLVVRCFPFFFFLI